jgi:hypothetical protein
MMRVLYRATLVAGAMVVAAPLAGVPAQSVVGRSVATSPRADSAQQARAAYRRSVAAYREHDLETARREMATAAQWWPTQQAYLEASARLAALARDPAGAAAWLRRLTDL